MLQLGKISTRDGDTSAQVLERVPVEAVVGESQSTAVGEDIGEILSRDFPATDRQALVMARIGQGEFRDKVLRMWSYQCAVTGCSVQDVIRASHIRPWRDSNHRDRLNPHNGLPLLATLDALFDRHLIAFNAPGKMLISPELSKDERKLLLPHQRQLRDSPTNETAKFLKEHAALLR